MKTITIIGVNYYPEDSAIGLYSTQLAEYLASNGFKVSVITGYPYYPAWEIDKNYRQKKTFLKETINQVEVYRYKQYVPKQPTFFKRIVHLMDFTLGSAINILKIKKTDMVLCIVPFTSSIILGKILASIKRAKLWVHIQDFELDAAAESDLIAKGRKPGISSKVLLRVERFLYNRANNLSTISNAMHRRLSNKSKTSISKHLLPNWVDIKAIDPSLKEQHSYLSSDKFKVLYSGNIGEKQDWEFFLKVVKELKKESTIEIVLVGDGAKKKWLQEALNKGLNVQIFSPVPYAELSSLVCSADVHILFQKSNVIDSIMPSKILAMMASQRPSIITGNKRSEVTTIIQEAKAGFYLDSDDVSGVVESIKFLHQNHQKRAEFGINARNYVEAHFSSEKILHKFKTSFEEVLENNN